jgi:hypothetical protein
LTATQRSEVDVSQSVCPPFDVFHVNLGAGFYAGIAGVLAGFAFVAMTYVLAGLQSQGGGIAHTREGRSTENTIIVSLFCAFLSLLITAILYASIASEGEISPRAASENMLAAVTIVYGTGVLIFSITLLISSAGLEHTAREVRTIVVLVLPAVAVRLTAQGAQTVVLNEIRWDSSTRCADSGLYDELGRWGGGVLPLVVLSASIALVVLSRTVLRPPRFLGFPQGSRWWLHNPLPKISLVVVIGTATRMASLSRRDAGDHLSDGEVWFWLGLIAVGLLAQSMVSLWTRPGVAVTEDSGRSRAL